MKNLFLTFLLLIFASTGFSQSNIDARLLERYSEAELVQMKKDNPEEYAILDRALDVGVVIADYPKGKEGFTTDGTLDIDPTKQHTFISLGLELLPRNQYFLIKDSDKIVIVYDKNTIMLIQ